MPPLKQIDPSFKFTTCDFSKKHTFFIFSGNWAFLQQKYQELLEPYKERKLSAELEHTYPQSERKV